MNLLLFRILCRLVTAGSRKHVVYTCPIPTGQKIFASNHPSNIDPAYFYHLMDDPVLMIMNWGMDIPIIGPIMRGCGFIPVGKDRHAAYSAALNALLSGRNVYICPEGKLSGPDAKAQTGAARLAIQTGFPIIPVGVRHEGRVYSIPVGNGRFIKYMPFGETHIKFGNRMYVYGKGAHFMTKQLMGGIARLSE